MIAHKFLYVPLLTVAILALAGCSSSGGAKISSSTASSEKAIEAQDSEPSLSPVKNITHAHGLALDAADKSKLYIATHNGLLLLKNEKDLYRIGDIQDDFMGFSAHPNRPETFFTSGHPERGGNIGIQRSDDGGISWKKLSNGVSGPVDFHSMALSPANQSLLYGWYGALQRSTDTGENWELLTTTLQNVISLTADPYQENVLYAGTNTGLQVSRDKGETWSVFSQQLSEGPITAVVVDPSNEQNMLSFSPSLGLVKSIDAGKNWQSITNELGIVLYFAFDPNGSNTVYALNRDNAIYKSIDGGSNWTLIL